MKAMHNIAHRHLIFKLQQEVQLNMREFELTKN